MAVGLTRDRVVAAALEVVREHGLDGLSMRKVAARLGVEAMSLYTHVRNKADLLDALYDDLLSRVPEAGDGPWREEAERLARAFRDVLFAERACVPLIATRPATTPSSWAVAASAIDLLVDRGFTEDGAFYAFQTMFSFVVGHAVFHTAGGFSDEDAAADEFEQGLAVVLAGIEAKLVP